MGETKQWEVSLSFLSTPFCPPRLSMAFLLRQEWVALKLGSLFLPERKILAFLCLPSSLPSPMVL
jgi:hypothetical protein